MSNKRCVSFAAAALVAAFVAVPAQAQPLTDVNMDAAASVLQSQPAAAADETNAEAMPDNPEAELPEQVSDAIPDDATVVSEDHAVTDDGELKDVETGETVTDPTLVGTGDTQPDPLAKTDGESFIPVAADEVKAKVAANGGDANATTSPDPAAAGTDASSATSSRATAKATVRNAALENSEYGAHWGTHNGTPAFFEADGKLFVQQAKGVIDVSEWQGDIDWAAVKKAGVDGAIIRLSYGWGNGLDKKAKRNISECKRLGIPFGIYTYSYAYDKAGATGEGKDMVSLLRKAGVKPADLSYPVYYDLEKWTWTGHTPPTSPSVYNGIVNAWWSQLTAAGYTNLSVYSYTNYLKGPLNSSNIHSKTRWVASYGARTGFTFSTNDRAWQYSSSGSVPGIEGSVDLNAFGNEKPKATVETAKPVYRLYHPGLRLHHYTADAHEKTVLVNERGWRYEGVPFKTSKKGVPVYRLYHPGIKQHLFTKSSHERDVLSRQRGWKYEGVAWYVSPNGKVPVYRLYNAGNMEHFYTNSSYEYKVRGSQGWTKEGIAWKGL